jgi:hypothetical protein
LGVRAIGSGCGENVLGLIVFGRGDLDDLVCRRGMGRGLGGPCWWICLGTGFEFNGLLIERAGSEGVDVRGRRGEVSMALFHFLRLL